MSTTAIDTTEGREKITTLKSTFYQYSYTPIAPGYTDKKYQVFSGGGNDYWMASRSVNCASRYIKFIVFQKHTSVVGMERGLFYTDGTAQSYGSGIRPVVTLSADVKIKTDGTNTGGSQDKAFTIE